MEPFVQLRTLTERREAIVIRLEQLPALIEAVREEYKPVLEREQTRLEGEREAVEAVMKGLGWEPEDAPEPEEPVKKKKK
jgi:hypothetical protein